MPLCLHCLLHFHLHLILVNLSLLAHLMMPIILIPTPLKTSYSIQLQHCMPPWKYLLIKWSLYATLQLKLCGLNGIWFKLNWTSKLMISLFIFIFVPFSKATPTIITNLMIYVIGGQNCMSPTDFLIIAVMPMAVIFSISLVMNQILKNVEGSLSI